MVSGQWSVICGRKGNGMPRKIVKPREDGTGGFDGWETTFETGLTLWEYISLSWLENREQFLLTVIVFWNFIRDLAVVLYLIFSR